MNEYVKVWGKQCPLSEKLQSADFGPRNRNAVTPVMVARATTSQDRSRSNRGALDSNWTLSRTTIITLTIHVSSDPYP